MIDLFKHFGDAIGKGPLTVPPQLMSALNTEEIQTVVSIRQQRSANLRFTEGSVHGRGTASSPKGSVKGGEGGSLTPRSPTLTLATVEAGEAQPRKAQ